MIQNRGPDTGAIIKIQPVFTYRSPPISSGTSWIVFLLLLRRDIPPGAKIAKLQKFLVSWSGSG